MRRLIVLALTMCLVTGAQAQLMDATTMLKLAKETYGKDFLVGAAEAQAAQYFKPWYGAYEFINRRPRHCLWLGDCSPAELRGMPECMKRVQAVRDFRLASKRASTLKLADKPIHFQTENMPKGHYIVIPQVSSERRRYIPIGYMDDGVL